MHTGSILRTGYLVEDKRITSFVIILVQVSVDDSPSNLGTFEARLLCFGHLPDGEKFEVSKLPTTRTSFTEGRKIIWTPTHDRNISPLQAVNPQPRIEPHQHRCTRLAVSGLINGQEISQYATVYGSSRLCGSIDTPPRLKNATRQKPYQHASPACLKMKHSTNPACIDQDGPPLQLKRASSGHRLKLDGAERGPMKLNGGIVLRSVRSHFVVGDSSELNLPSIDNGSWESLSSLAKIARTIQTGMNFARPGLLVCWPAQEERPAPRALVGGTLALALVPLLAASRTQTVRRPIYSLALSVVYRASVSRFQVCTNTAKITECPVEQGSSKSAGGGYFDDTNEDLSKNGESGKGQKRGNGGARDLGSNGDRPEKRPRKSKNSEDLTEDDKELYPCHYYILDPERYWQCATVRVARWDIHRLKTHLEDKHRIHLLCRTCQKEFKRAQLKDFQEHEKSKTCFPAERDWSRGFDIYQAEEFAKKKYKLPGRQYWDELWRIFFPQFSEQNVPSPSPFVDPKVRQCLGHTFRQAKDFGNDTLGPNFDGCKNCGGYTNVQKFCEAAALSYTNTNRARTRHLPLDEIVRTMRFELQMANPSPEELRPGLPDLSTIAQESASSIGGSRTVVPALPEQPTSNQSRPILPWTSSPLIAQTGVSVYQSGPDLLVGETYNGRQGALHTQRESVGRLQDHNTLNVPSLNFHPPSWVPLPSEPSPRQMHWPNYGVFFRRNDPSSLPVPTPSWTRSSQRSDTHQYQSSGSFDMSQYSTTSDSSVLEQAFAETGTGDLSTDICVGEQDRLTSQMWPGPHLASAHETDTSSTPILDEFHNDQLLDPFPSHQHQVQRTGEIHESSKKGRQAAVTDFEEDGIG